MLHGEVAHGDSLGNNGVIEAGDVQWMTAGSGIIHEEMPHQTSRLLHGFQLWANLPKHHKMMHPRYRDVKKNQIPIVKINDDVSVRIICGELNSVTGPVQDIITDPEYFDVSIKPNKKFVHHIKRGYNIFTYIIEGNASFGSGNTLVEIENLVIFEDGDNISVTSGDSGVRFLLCSGKPIGEPVAWYGPIVMNTEEELNLAFKEYAEGTFIKHSTPPKEGRDT